MKTYFVGEDAYTIIRSNRKTVSIQLKTNGKLVARAPIEMPLYQIIDFVESKESWIAKTKIKIQNALELQKSRARGFTDKSTHHFLGKEYVLNLKIEEQLSIKLEEDQITICTPLPENEQLTEGVLYNFYKKESISYFEGRLQQLIKLHPTFEKRYQFFSVRRMKSRWGSCSSDGRLKLNTELMRTPKACIDYVILHELCHLVHMNHSSDFHDLVSRFMPNWKVIRKELNTYSLR